ncbi:MAG: hypothetical protein C0412_00055 [Flavobacterium sp.]|nr:hypothetical protein [Flavobacterium sp.]
MENILSLTPEKKLLFEKIISDLRFACKDLSTEELLQIFKDASLHSAKIVFITKKQAIKNASDLFKTTYKRYKQIGVVESAKADAKRVNEFVLSLPDKMQNVYYKFLKLNREEQIEVVVVTILTVAIFFAVSGGTDLEGGVIDLDLAIGGLGHHRSIFTHSIFIGLSMEFVGRFTINTLEKVKNRMPIDRHQIWDKVFGYIDKHKEKAVAAMWLGISAHLLKDSGIFGDGVTSYKNLPFSMPMEGHQGMFAANGVASGLASLAVKH